MALGENYYAEKLNSEKLFQVYETQIARVRQYLAAEIQFVRQRLTGTEKVLELGAGYGRIVKELAPHCASIVGVDVSSESVALGTAYLSGRPNAEMRRMDVHQLSLQETFDVILCLQNGLSAMRMTPEAAAKALSALASGGAAFFSSYSERFWDYRLQWFQEQAAKGLLGELDMERTKDGVIVCKDGFKATTYSPAELARLGESLGLPYEIEEVDDSSLFLIIRKR